MDLWHSNNIKFILRNFAKDHCFWTLWTLNYVDCIFFLALILSIWLTIKPNNSRKFHSRISKKTWSNLYLSGRGPIKSFLFVCSPVFLSFCLRHIFLRIYSVGFLNFPWGYFTMYTKKWQSRTLENCISCLDNWVNKTNLDRKLNLWHFNGGSITFGALNYAP